MIREQLDVSYRQTDLVTRAYRYRAHYVAGFVDVQIQHTMPRDMRVLRLIAIRIHRFESARP